MFEGHLSFLPQKTGSAALAARPVNIRTTFAGTNRGLYDAWLVAGKMTKMVQLQDDGLLLKCRWVPMKKHMGPKTIPIGS